MAKRNVKVTVNDLRWRCNPNWFSADRSDKIKPADEIIGQDRALEAIQTGLDIKSHGYNIYVSGLTGTGKMTTIEMLLEQIKTESKIPGDICYVYNFTNPNHPTAVYLLPGKGKELKSDMGKMIEELSQIIPGIEENEQFQGERKTLIARYKQKNQAIFQEFEKEVQSKGLALMQVQIGGVQRPEIFPVIEKQVTPWEKMAELVDSQKIKKEDAKELQNRHDELMEKLDTVFQEAKSVESELVEKLNALQYKYLKPNLVHWLRILKRKYENEKLHTYFERICRYITVHTDDFKTTKKPETEQPLLPILQTKKAKSKDPFLIYQVNVVVDNCDLKRPPIIVETTPTFQNLFGTIEHTLESGGFWQSDFTKINAGSILHANGGYLVFNFLDAVNADPRVWTSLKRVLKNNEITIQSENLPFGVSTSAIRPEPIKVDLKVLVIGDYYTYNYLYEHDDEFRKIFKIRADFDTEMRNNKNAVKKYASFISKICADESLLIVDRTGMAAVVEEGVRIAGRNNYLSTRFSDIADLVRESHYWAKKQDSNIITERHVQIALTARKKRLQMTEDKLQRLILDGILLIETTGEKVGQVNGISIFELGDYSFGKPSKITVEIGLGNTGIINIEREAELGGKVYNKGVLIISGYLNGKYAKNLPLTMNASICFEQSYSGVDGDSASAAEIFALLSSIAEIPLRQDLAVTGSVNQKGEIQPIGGVNQKIEGVYEVCKARGFTGKQGAIIPEQNVSDLMLPFEIINSVENNEFSIYSIKTIDEGIELLTGISAGKMNKQGNYPPNSVHALVQQKLHQLAEKMKEFEGGISGN